MILDEDLPVSLQGHTREFVFFGGGEQRWESLCSLVVFETLMSKEFVLPEESVLREGGVR